MNSQEAEQLYSFLRQNKFLLPYYEAFISENLTEEILVSLDDALLGEISRKLNMKLEDYAALAKLIKDSRSLQILLHLKTNLHWISQVLPQLHLLISLHLRL